MTEPCFDVPAGPAGAVGAVVASLLLVTMLVQAGQDPGTVAGHQSRAMPGHDVALAHEPVVPRHPDGTDRGPDRTDRRPDGTDGTRPDRADGARPDRTDRTRPDRTGPGSGARPDRTAVLPPTHTVGPGDTLSAVGQRYGVSTQALARANAVDRRDTLRPGQTLVIPRGGPPRPNSPEEVMAANLAVEGLLVQTAAAHALDDALVKAVAWSESRWRQRLVSDQGAIGIMQVRPPTGRAVSHHLGRDLDLHDATDNVVAGSAYLALLLDRYDGDVTTALAAYHQGPQSLAERGPIPATQRYVGQVLDLQRRFAAAVAAR